MINNDERSLSVLLVENDSDVLHLVKRSLEDNLTFPSWVDHASTLDEALKKLNKNQYHLMLVESQLEEESGLKLLEEVQRMKTPVAAVVLIPVRDDKMIEEAMRLGAVDLIIKSESQFHELGDMLRSSYQKFHRRKSKRAGKAREEEVIPLESLLPPADLHVEVQRQTHAIRDELTGLYNHSHLHDRLIREFSQATRYGYPVSCLMIDMDHFKTVNEEYGYHIGEELLKDGAALMFQNCRLSDFIARYGGEEFVVILPHTSYQGAQEVANRLRLVFAEHLFNIESREISMTVSIGVSAFPEDGIKQPAELISFSNQALLRSKVAGRNRVSLYKEIVPTFGDGLPTLKISEDKIVEFQRRMTDIFNVARRGYIEASKALIMALESKDRFTAGHAATVAKYCMQTAEAMGMSIEEAEIVQHAGLLHDIGKICIPDSVLLKPSRLTFTEFETMKQHPYMGYKILKPIKFLQQEAILVLHHHEWFNGEGYPCRLKANEIPLGARIIAVVDSYDTMRFSGGRYKKTFTVESAVNELIDCCSTQFDPDVVKYFIDVLKMRGELASEDYNKQKLEEHIQAVHPTPGADASPTAA